VSALVTLLAGLIDDAGQFPPARKPIDSAVADHRAARTGDHAWIVGRFLCPAGALRDGLPRPLGVVAGGEDDLEPALQAGADAFEVRGSRDLDLDALAAAPLEVFVEGMRPAEVAEAGVGAKIRCGGERVPSASEVADFIAECRRLGVRFKATAGLHHPFRSRSEHGFVNLLAATAVQVDDLESVIAEDEPDAFTLSASGLAWRGHPWSASAARRLFTAYGSCSLEEPIQDLVAHGIL
jgi:hypothetical protein